jgi:hypothetical protein
MANKEQGWQMHSIHNYLRQKIEAGEYSAEGYSFHETDYSPILIIFCSHECFAFATATQKKRGFAMT